MTETVEVAIAIVFRGGRILICQRKPEGRLGGYWEFPGGKIEPNETPEQCVQREAREELAIEVHPTRALAIIEHDYGDVRVRLHPFLCQHLEGEPKPLASQQALWVSPDDLPRYRFPPANDGLLKRLIEMNATGDIAT